MNSDAMASYSGVGWTSVAEEAEPWFMRSTSYSEPNGDYTAYCWLDIWGWDDSVGFEFNDGSCSACSDRYLCSSNDADPAPTQPPTVTPAPTVTSAPTPCRDDSTKCSDSGWDCWHVRFGARSRHALTDTQPFPPRPANARADLGVRMKGAMRAIRPHALVDAGPSQAPTLTADPSQAPTSSAPTVSSAPTFTAEPTTAPTVGYRCPSDFYDCGSCCDYDGDCACDHECGNGYWRLCGADHDESEYENLFDGIEDFTWSGSGNCIICSFDKLWYRYYSCRRATPIAAGAATWTGTAKGTSGRKDDWQLSGLATVEYEGDNNDITSLLQSGLCVWDAYEFDARHECDWGMCMARYELSSKERRAMRLPRLSLGFEVWNRGNWQPTFSRWGERGNFVPLGFFTGFEADDGDEAYEHSDAGQRCMGTHGDTFQFPLQNIDMQTSGITVTKDRERIERSHLRTRIPWRNPLATSISPRCCSCC